MPSDNIVVWLPDSHIPFAGCLVRSGSATHLGYTGEADLVAWPDTVMTLLERYDSARLLVPGHDSPGGRELLEHTLELLERD